MLCLSTHLTINHIPLGAELKTCDNQSGLIICIAKGMIYPSESSAKPTVKALSISLSLCLSVSHTLHLSHESLQKDVCGETRIQRCRFCSNKVYRMTFLLDNIFYTSNFCPSFITNLNHHEPSYHDNQRIFTIKIWANQCHYDNIRHQVKGRVYDGAREGASNWINSAERPEWKDKH